MICHLPSTHDQTVITTALQVYLHSQSGAVRDTVLGAIYFTLKQRGANAMKMPGYTVIRCKDDRLFFYAGCRSQNGRCPQCGNQAHTKVLNVAGNYAHYACSCGKLFRVKNHQNTDWRRVIDE